MLSRAALAFLALLLACDSGCGAEPESEPPPEPEPTTGETEPAPVVELAELVPTRALEPDPIHITVEELPEPFATDSARKSPDVVPIPDDAELAVPEGFVVQRFATEVPMARWLAVTPDGRVLVAQSREEQITWYRDTDGDGVADERGVFADDANSVDIPFGMAFERGAFFLGNQDEVRRFEWREGQTRLEGEGERVVALPGGGYNQHWTRNVIPAGDGRHLFVSVGSATNVSREDPPRAAISRLDLETGELSTYASGLRNPVGLATHPESGDLYTTVNERDGLGDDLVPDFFTEVAEGAFYGWPYAYLTPENLDPRRMDGERSEAPELVARTRTPEVLFQSHSAALGLAFHPREPFPERYRHGAFVAHRGSWNRSEGTGYRIVFVPFEEGEPVGSYEPFVDGFLIDPSGPTTWGRPVGVLSHPDGSLYFTEEANGVVYRVSYRP
jgi:glucose/arabinose dehydrogenase